MSTITVAIDNPYEVHIEHGALSQLASYIQPLKDPCKVAIISDDNVAAHYLAPVKENMEAAGYQVISYVFPHGEEQKNPTRLIEIIEYLAKEELTRKDLVIALGGGVVGDMAGFAAATYQRGIDYVQVPTSLLAMVDSSVGGKTAVNLSAGKNLWGVFKQPITVVCDPDTLQTLPKAEFVNGCAEIIKYGMIGNITLLDHLEKRPLTEFPEDVESVIATSVEDKAGVVAIDEKETGWRQVLNFGHTFAHGIEKYSNFTVPHGNAVAVGMMMMTRAAVKEGIYTEEDLERLTKLIKAHHLPTTTDIPVDLLLEAAKHDKKSHGKTITIALPISWGRCALKTITHDELVHYAIPE